MNVTPGKYDRSHLNQMILNSFIIQHNLIMNKSTPDILSQISSPVQSYEERLVRVRKRCVVVENALKLFYKKCDLFQ